MRFQLLTLLAATITLAACAATGSDGTASSSADSEGVATDAGVAVTDSGTDSGTDGGTSSVDGGAADGGPTVATYAEEAPVIAAHCSSCHHSQFGTLAAIQQDRAKLITELQLSKMPKDDPSWATSADGLALLAFLQSSPELN